LYDARPELDENITDI